MNTWEREYPEFKEAREIGIAQCMLFFEKMGLSGAAGKIKNFNALAYKIQLDHRFINPVDAIKKQITQVGVSITNGVMDSVQQTQKPAEVKIISNFIELPDNGRDGGSPEMVELIEVSEYTVAS